MRKTQISKSARCVFLLLTAPTGNEGITQLSRFDTQFGLNEENDMSNKLSKPVKDDNSLKL